MPEFDHPRVHAVTDEAITAEQLESDEVDLRDGLAGLAGLVANARGVREMLSEVAGFAAQAIPGIDGLGVTALHVADGELRIRAWEVTAPFVREIDILQYQILNDGPCITAMQTRQAVVSGALGADPRWTRFGCRAAALGVESALSLPLLIADQVIGSINCYARAGDAFGEHAVRLGSQFAGPAAVSVYNTQLLIETRERAEQLQRALVSRKVIDQAIGILRGRAGGTADEAFERLKRISQNENVKLAVVAERIVDDAVRRAQARNRPS